MKKTFFIALTIISCMIAFNGCKSQNSNCTDCTPKSGLFGSFGDERYIWEDFFFSTNRIENVK